MDTKKIFFSYGHDSIDKVLRIKKSLEEAGYIVWLDTEGILPGDDWRAEITQAILKCDTVLAFFSEHSLRKDSVCLNELAIAVGHKAGAVRTVLLKSEIVDKIPATVSWIQYCDLGEWEQKAALSSQEFQNWYNRKIQEIISALEKGGDAERDVQIQYLEQVLSPALESNRRNIELQKPFVSRTWMEQKIDEWLAKSDSSQYLLMYGGPGTGKSAFSAHYFHFNSKVVGSVFCEWGCRNYSSASQIIKSIAYQIALKLPTYRMRLAGILENCGRDLSAYSVQELFDLLLLKPLYGDTAEDRIILVIIDGVDEANEFSGNELAEVLSEYSSRIPSFLKILLTSRNDSIVQRYFSDCEQLHIDIHTDENNGDIYRYLKEQLWDIMDDYPKWRREQVLREFARKSGSSFLYAELLVKSVRSEAVSVDQADTVPKGLNGLYFNWMRRKFPDEMQYEEEYAPALSLIAAVNQLPVRMLDKTIGMKGIKFRKFMRRLKTFLETEENVFGEECVYFFHKSFAEWLCSENADVYELSAEDGMQMLAETMADSYANNDLTDFEAEHLLEYLQESHMYELYRKVSSDGRYLQRLYQLAQHCESLSGGYEHALRLYEKIAMFLKNTDPEDRELQGLRCRAVCGRGRCLFALGDYEGALEVLSKEREDIMERCDAEEQMHALMIIGCACDWKGDRQQSADVFEELLSFAKKEGSSHYMLRGYAGLFWNDCFNDIEQAVSHLSAIQSMKLSEKDKVTFELCTARILLSMGRLSEAMERYDKCFQNYDFSQYEDYYSMKKNKMLLLEILPACFDNERYLDGVRFGLKIWGCIRNHGWLEECYCSAWIALNYLMLGDVEAAEQFLYHAQACNNTMTDTKSQWMEMQLTSVEAFLHFEKEEYEEALETKRKVLAHARECNDAWIQGDTCFEILSILLIFDRDTDPHSDRTKEEINSLEHELREVSSSSGLPHLQCKYLMIKAVQAAYEGNQSGLSLVEEAKKRSNHYQLASMDPVQMLYIEYCVLSELDAAGGNKVRQEIGRTISKIDTLNSGDEHDRTERKLVKRIKREVFGDECEC